MIAGAREQEREQGERVDDVLVDERVVLGYWGGGTEQQHLRRPGNRRNPHPDAEHQRHADTSIPSMNSHSTTGVPAMSRNTLTIGPSVPWRRKPLVGDPPLIQAAAPSKSTLPSSLRPVAKPKASSLSRKDQRKTSPSEIRSSAHTRDAAAPDGRESTVGANGTAVLADAAIVPPY